MNTKQLHTKLATLGFEMALEADPNGDEYIDAGDMQIQVSGGLIVMYIPGDDAIKCTDVQSDSELLRERIQTLLGEKSANHHRSPH